MEDTIIYTSGNFKGRYQKGFTYVNTDYIGKKYGRWTILNFSKNSIQPSGKKRQVWTCKCDCGTIRDIFIDSITQQKSKSCGCYYKELKEKERLPDRIASVNTKYSQYKNSANKRKINFELTIEEYDNLIHGNCFYCGAGPKIRNFKRKTSSYNYPMNGIDRVNNNEGYTVKNSVSCCDTCNRAKLDHDLKYFLNWIKKVSDNIDSIKKHNNFKQ